MTAIPRWVLGLVVLVAGYGTLAIPAASQSPAMEDFVTSEIGSNIVTWSTLASNDGYSNLYTPVGHSFVGPGEQVSTGCGDTVSGDSGLSYCMVDTYTADGQQQWGVLYLPVVTLNTMYTGGGGSYTQWNGPGVVQVYVAIGYAAHLTAALVARTPGQSVPAGDATVAFRYCAAGLYMAGAGGDRAQIEWDMASLLNELDFAGSDRQVRYNAFMTGLNDAPQMDPSQDGLARCIGDYWPR